jgi:membrane protein DedA with SNARE-associated domain
MFELIQQFASYAPAVIFIASVLDIFFVTGLFLYGAAMLGSIAMMYSTGMITLEMIIVSSYLGTLLGNSLNYFSGRMFDKAPFIERKLQHPKVQKVRKLLQTKSLFIYILVCRFIAVSRPLYALVLGSLKVNFGRFILYESLVALAWVIFWLFILVQGESLFSHIFK